MAKSHDLHALNEENAKVISSLKQSLNNFDLYSGQSGCLTRGYVGINANISINTQNHVAITLPTIVSGSSETFKDALKKAGFTFPYIGNGIVFDLGDDNYPTRLDDLRKQADAHAISKFVRNLKAQIDFTSLDRQEMLLSALETDLGVNIPGKKKEPVEAVKEAPQHSNQPLPTKHTDRAPQQSRRSGQYTGPSSNSHGHK